MVENGPKAKVFVSCGQRESFERQAAERIGEVLQEAGYEYYIAAAEASLTGLKENIYRQLEGSEYILFVDFRREQLANLQAFRGSLFSHQELAVAAYLGLEWMPFQQEGVERNGIMGFVQSNVIPFSDPGDLPTLVRTQIETLGWSPNWKNAVVIERDPTEHVDIANQAAQMTRFLHLTVRNLNPRKAALNCVGYLERIKNSGTGQELPLKTVELRWAGYTLPNATILGRSQRDLDLGYVFHTSPQMLCFNSFTTSSEYMPPLPGPGVFELDYVVMAENFPPARATFRLTLRRQLSQLQVEMI